MSLAMLPTLNAILNATSAACLVTGWCCIKAGRMPAHAACMIAACIASLMFLTSYLWYHAHVGSVRFTGTGWSRPAYIALLMSHTVLAVSIIPLVGRTLWLAAGKRFDAHRAIARWTLPLWLYVSITGVVVYWMLYHLQ